MRRLLASAFTFVVLVGILFIPAALYGVDLDSATTTESTTITDYKADFTVSDDGDLDVKQTLTVNFPVGGKHGIFEFFDRVDASQPDVRRLVEDVEVTVDGNDVPVDHSVENGRYDAYKIGDPDSTLSVGDHVYKITYHLPAVLTPGGDQVDTESQFYWNLIPSGWEQDITRSRLTVHLPAEADDVHCAIGTGTIGSGDADECDKVAGMGSRDLTIRTGALSDHTPVTLLVGQDVPTPEQPTLPWKPRYDDVLGTSVPQLGLVAGGSVVLGLFGMFLAFLGFERKPRFPLMYAPPEGIGPAQAQFMLEESVDQRSFVASLMHAAEHGAIDLQRAEDKSWTITDKTGPQGWAGLDPMTTSVAGLLSGPGSHFVARPKDVGAGQRLQTQVASFTAGVKTWAMSSGLLERAGIGGFGGLLVLGCVGLVVVNVFANPFDMSMSALPVAALAAGAVPLLTPGSATKRTPAGRELWSRVGGFRRILSTPSSKDRFDFSGRQELYTAYLPYAVAFDCAKQWADKYRIEMGTEPPTPAYFYGYGSGYGTTGLVDSMVGDFDSTLSSAISSYQATQSSSSSGGGGFSGGGGGGGGGGGSW
jgi:uncharacterized membrane protein YgcG